MKTMMPHHAYAIIDVEVHDYLKDTDPLAFWKELAYPTLE